MLDRVATRYGHLTGKQLEELSHAEAPYIGTELKKEIPYELSFYRGTDFSDLWWKVELVVPNSGLRPNQYPRAWFAVKGTNIAFLCISSHIDNYNDAQMDKIALSRVTYLF